MESKVINRKYYLIGMIGCLFLFVLGLIGWCGGANSTHKDLRLRIKKIDKSDFEMKNPYSTSVQFTFTDSLLNEGYSFGDYIVFGENEEGYDVPLHSSVIPSFTKPSVECIESYEANHHKNSKNINKLLYEYDYLSISFHDSVYFCSMQILKMAQDRNATICAIIPSYSISDKTSGVSDMEIDGVLLSQLMKESVNTEWMADSLMTSIYCELKEYCDKEHCNVGDNHFKNLAETLSIHKREALKCVSKDEIKKWLEVHNDQIKKLAKECPDIYNASSQLLDSYHWITQQNYEKVISISKSRTDNWKYIDSWDYDDIRDKEEIDQICNIIGYDGDKESIDKFMYTIRFWSIRWDEGDAEWIYNWLKGIM